MGRREKKKKGGIGNVISTLILIIAIGIFAFALVRSLQKNCHNAHFAKFFHLNDSSLYD